MKRFIRFFRMPRADRQLPELIRELPSLSKQQRQEIFTDIGKLADWRLTLQCVAEVIGKAERDVVLQLSAVSRVPYIDPIPDVSTRPPIKLRASVSELRRCGATPIYRRDEIVAFACVDPARARKVLSSLYPQATYCLATWFQIARALDSTERILLEERQAEEEARLARGRHEARQVLSFIIGEVRQFGGESVRLIADHRGRRYEFLTGKNVRGEGTIEDDIWQPLVHVIRSGDLGSIPVDWRDESQGIGEALRVSWHSLSPVEARGPVGRYESNQTLDVDKILPFPERAAMTPRALPTSTQSVTEDGPTVLIVDDDPLFASILGKFLLRHGLRTLQVRSGEEALRLLESTAVLPSAVLPSLIISDLNMPEMNGAEFLAALKASARLSEIPTIILTSEDDVETKIELLTTGAHIFLSKAEDPRILALEADRLSRRPAKRGAA